MPTIPSDLVNKYYEMNPSTDDLIPHAALLREGMVVLIESSGIRSDVTDILRNDVVVSDETVERARKLNRWARVSHIHIEDGYLHFVAEYADGIKRKRQHKTSYGWLVKIDSLGWERDVADIAAECRLAPSVTFALLAQGWKYVTNPNGDNPNEFGWTKTLEPSVSEQRRQREEYKQQAFEEEKQTVLKLKKEGLSIQDIANRLRMAETTVLAYLRHNQDPES